MRVRLTVTPPYRITPDHWSVDREAGANPARTRHCDRGCSPHARDRSHWPRRGAGKARRGWAREPGDLLPTGQAQRPRGKGWLLKLHRVAGLLAGLCCLIAAPAASAAPVTVNLRI